MASEAAPAEPTTPWADFLADHPPDKLRLIDMLGSHMMPPGPNFVLHTPELRLNCASAECGGLRTFRCEAGAGQLDFGRWNHVFLTYQCRNCQKTTKLYALRIRWTYSRREVKAYSGPSLGLISPPRQYETTDIAEALKLGEHPPLGPVLHRRLAKLFDADSELFALGRRAEGFGMGIGAFAYYRRVVENQRTAIFDRLIQAAERLKADPSVIAALESDRDNWRFSESVDSLKALLPEQLKIGGSSPVALLHSALSHNLHNESDAVCLQAASDIRLVLEGFAELVDAVLKDQAELEKAIGRLTRRTAGS